MLRFEVLHHIYFEFHDGLRGPKSSALDTLERESFPITCYVSKVFPALLTHQSPANKRKCNETKKLGKLKKFSFLNGKQKKWKK